MLGSKSIISDVENICILKANTLDDTDSEQQHIRVLIEFPTTAFLNAQQATS